MTWQKLFGERATTKLVAVFDTAAAAEDAAHRFKSTAGLNAGQVRILVPGDTRFDIKIEPEPAGVARTAIRTHVVFGIVGFVLGVLLWFGLFATQFNLVRGTPIASAVAIVFFLTMAGMLLGGFLTLRPDHQVLITRLRSALEDGKWCVVIHPRSPAECEQIEAMLAGEDAQTMRSI